LDLAFHHHVQDGALGERRRGPDERVNGKKQDSGDKSFENGERHCGIVTSHSWDFTPQ
jgi:hypothetical protein